MSNIAESREVWAWAEAEDADRWDQAGTTREEAIAYAYAHGVGEDFGFGYICEGRHFNPAGAAADAIDMEDLLERMNEQDECCGFDDPVFETDVAEEDAEQALREAIFDWAHDHLTAGGKFTLTGTPERVPPRAA